MRSTLFGNKVFYLHLHQNQPQESAHELKCRSPTSLLSTFLTNVLCVIFFYKNISWWLLRQGGCFEAWSLPSLQLLACCIWSSFSTLHSSLLFDCALNNNVVRASGLLSHKYRGQTSWKSYQICFFACGTMFAVTTNSQPLIFIFIPEWSLSVIFFLVLMLSLSLFSVYWIHFPPPVSNWKEGRAWMSKIYVIHSTQQDRHQFKDYQTELRSAH